MGFPGTTHVNRVWRNLILCQSPHDFFLQNEYLVADTAYELSDEVIHAFKSSPGMGLLQTHDNCSICVLHPHERLQSILWAYGKEDLDGSVKLE